MVIKWTSADGCICTAPGSTSDWYGNITQQLSLHVRTDYHSELHPWLQQPGFAEWHKKNNILIMQYSPFGNANAIYDKGQKMGQLMEDPTLVEIGKKYGKSGAQVALAWGIAHG